MSLVAIAGTISRTARRLKESKIKLNHPNLAGTGVELATVKVSGNEHNVINIGFSPIEKESTNKLGLSCAKLRKSWG